MVTMPFTPTANGTQYITGIAIDPNGNTSEFSPCRDLLRNSVITPKTLQIPNSNFTQTPADIILFFVPNNLTPALLPGATYVTLARAAQICDVNHFNWTQTITGLPSDDVEFLYPLQDSEGNNVNFPPPQSLRSYPNTLYDPVPSSTSSYGIHSDIVEQMALIDFPNGDTQIDTADADNYNYYMNEAPDNVGGLGDTYNYVTFNPETRIGTENPNFSTANGLLFWDRPSLWEPFNPGGNGQTTFLTQLTGVFGNETGVVWGGISNTNFTWADNAVRNLTTGATTGGATNISFQSVPLGTVLPPVSSGGVFDVQYEVGGATSTATSLFAVSGNGTFGGTGTLTATLFSNGYPLAGQTITFTLTTGTTSTTVGSATTGSNGVATLTGVSLAGFDAGTATGAVGASFAGDASNAASSASGDLTVSPAQATLTPSGLVFTYDGASHTVTVTTSPAGLSGVMVTYTQGGATVAAPTSAGSYEFTASLANPNYTAPNATGTLVINPATPSITWANPAEITYGTPLSATQLDAAASVPGNFLYTPALGTVLASGGQMLSVYFTPTDSADYTNASATATINVAQHVTNTTLVASTPEGAPGQTITFTATVAGGLPSPYLPTGSVQFQINGVSSLVPLTANDTAAFSTTEPASGSFTVTAVYSGDTNFAVSQSTYTESVLSPGVYAVGSTLYVVGANSSDYALISPYGSKLDGSTGLAVVATLNNAITAKAFSQTFTDIDVFGYGGNDVFLLIPTLTLPTTVVEGNGNNYLLLAGGNVSVTLGSGSNQVFGGNGNKTITASDPAGTSGYIFLGNGNENIQLGQGNDTVTVGNGNDNVQLGNGSDVIVEGNGNDYVSAGNGSDLVVGGLGQHTIQLRNGNDILIDGSATVVNSGDSLRQILSDWNKSSSASVNTRLNVVYNMSHPNMLKAGSGRDWWFYTYSKDMTNKKLTDRWN